MLLSVLNQNLLVEKMQAALVLWTLYWSR